MKIKTSELEGTALDWAVAYCVEPEHTRERIKNLPILVTHRKYSADWTLGGPIIESANITIIRANDTYEKDAQGAFEYTPVWFAECDQWTGHNLSESYEGEHMDPTFMIGEGGGYYGPTPLVAAMRAYVALKLGNEIEIPEELWQLI